MLWSNALQALTDIHHRYEQLHDALLALPTQYPFFIDCSLKTGGKQDYMKVQCYLLIAGLQAAAESAEAPCAAHDIVPI